MNQRSPFKPYKGPPSKLHPNIFKGQIVGGGYLARNQRPNSDGAPSFKGRIYVPGCGWLWLAAWTQTREGKGSYFSLKVEPMSDDDADRYCAPRREPTPRPQAQPQPEVMDPDDIPF